MLERRELNRQIDELRAALASVAPDHPLVAGEKLVA